MPQRLFFYFNENAGYLLKNVFAKNITLASGFVLGDMQAVPISLTGYRLG
jgi:hypothetical protein